MQSTVRLTPEVNEMIEKLREGTFHSYSDVITIAIISYWQRKQKEPKVYDLRDAQDGDA